MLSAGKSLKAPLRHPPILRADLILHIHDRAGFFNKFMMPATIVHVLLVNMRKEDRENERISRSFFEDFFIDHFRYMILRGRVFSAPKVLTP